jgi:CrcB protein
MYVLPPPHKRTEGGMGLDTYIYVALGGALGTLARFGLGLAAAPISQSLPWGTIIINILGSFVIGFVGTLTLAHGRFPVPENLRLFVMVGLCGGFTTFSSFSLQTLDLLRGGAMTRAFANIALSVLLCLAAVAIGHAVASRLNGGRTEIAQIQMEEEA